MWLIGFVWAMGSQVALAQDAVPLLSGTWTLDRAASEMLGAHFVEIRSEATGRHLVLIDAIAR